MSTIACHPNEVPVAFWNLLVPPTLDANKALIMFLSYMKNEIIITQDVNYVPGVLDMSTRKYDLVG